MAPGYLIAVLIRIPPVTPTGYNPPVAYQSVDQLQLTLADTVFHYTQDKKKASGRALGTLVEVITFYLLQSWGFEQSLSIERHLAEYGNADIAHNVEYTLHPRIGDVDLAIDSPRLPLTAARILSNLPNDSFPNVDFSRSANTLLSSAEILRNACIIATDALSYLVATLTSRSQHGFQVALNRLYSKPYAMFECKRVGVEEGMKKGPQTIEKAKQGAYVARAVSSLQKVRSMSGELHGVLYRDDGTLTAKPYLEMISEIVESTDAELLCDFVLTVGVVSNHGNWFSSEDHNKELRVLAQSYDWLLFLTDEGLSEFITELLLEPVPELEPAGNAFLASYTGRHGKNRFTKLQMDYEADRVLQGYFETHSDEVEGWFNVIAPAHTSISKLRSELDQLRAKPWKEIHAL